MAINLENATVRMVEDMALTDQLTDDTAKVMHQWATGQLQLMANRHDDEAAFEDAFTQLRGVLKLVNKFIGGRARMDDEKQRTYVRIIIEKAQEAGYPPQLSSVGTVVDAQKTLDDHLTLRALLALVETGSTTMGRPAVGSAIADGAAGDDLQEEEKTEIDPNTRNPFMNRKSTLGDVPGMDVE